jgi:pimeloyl-ACP methyl ester carboxylesterase
MVERFAATSAGRVRYLEGGAGWPLLLLHAFPLAADMWRPQLEHPPAGRRIIAPDLPGFGPAAEDLPAGPASMADMASSVVSLLDALEIESATIGGLSMGAYVTMAMYRRAPERFTGLILADTKLQEDTPEARDARRKMLDLVRGGGAQAVADEMLPKLLGETSRRERPDLQDMVRDMIEANRPEGIAAAIEAMMTRPDSTELMSGMSCPTLIVVGAEDRLTPPAEAESMSRTIARSQLVVIPAAGHLSNLEAPVAFSKALENFLVSNI